MKLAGTIVTMIFVGGMLASCAVAAESKPKESKSPESKAAPRGESTNPAKNVDDAALRAEFHRTLTSLREARSAEDPNAAKVAELEQALRQLRRQLAAQGGPGFGNGRGQGCPWGGPGMGMGYGRGAGWGGGQGYGPGCGRGPGYGRGMGPGYGRGLGPGAGQGRAPGGPAFVDNDGDGICDRYQQRSGASR